jgi:hypothetical protein
LECEHGGEPGGDGVQAGETGTELAGGKGNNRGFEEEANGFKGTKVSLRSSTTTTIGGGVVRPRVGKYVEVLGSKPWYNLRGERSDEDFSLQSQIRRGKLNRNTPKIQSSRNSCRRYDRKRRSRYGSF